MLQPQASNGPPAVATVRLVGGAMAASVALFSIVALIFAGRAETALPGAAVWAIAGAALALLGAGQALDGQEPGRRIAAFAAREGGGLLGAVLTFLTGSWIFAAALGTLSVATIVLALPSAASTSRR
ncbi:MAG TPA: hypothetical protein VLA66_02975 [Thermoanaerobaculia bacterium]|nr:hypothetical protein [Thermoanaerobaculia bacterium]